ncbi:MAG: TonB-dependent receptor [Acidobacteriia bacterium]|nr:TonB-dependent receptor [Terriglobia bacterium]
MRTQKGIAGVAIAALVVGLLLLGSTAPAFAQAAGAGTINGTITDQQNAVVPEATITIHNVDTNVDRAFTSNGAGIYTVPFLQPGRYEVSVSKTGFAKLIRKDVTLTVGQTLTLDFQMPVQSTQESVTVTTENPLVDTEKTDVSQLVSTAEVANLPIAGRNWERFALTAPGANPDGGTGLVSYRGISALYNSSSVDGANNNQAFFSETKGRTVTGVPSVYSMDSIQEFAVTTSNYSAELGQAAGGVINAVTKSGTNTVHGDLFYYLRYPTLNALDPIQKAAGIYTQPIHQQQQFGGSVSGPIIKDKLFFFLTYDGSRKVNPIAYTSSSRFPLNCTSAFSAAQCAAANGYLTSILGAYPRFANNDIAFGRLDYQLNPRNHINSSLNIDDFKAPNSYTSSTTATNSSLSQNGTNVLHERIFVANWDSTISNTMINNFRFQWSRDLETTSANGAGPSVSITNVGGYGMPNALPRPAFPDEHRLQFTDILSMTHGKHTFKAGFDVNAIHELLINLFQGGGVYSYSGAAAFTNWAADVMGVNLGDNLTGRHFSTFVQVNDPVTHVGKDDLYDNDVDGFFEDSWKLKPNLTLNLGVRYDIQLIPAPPQPNTKTPLTTLYTSTINIDKNNFAPRIGLAWSLGKGTVVRAGYGMFYGKTSNSTYYATRVENGVFQQTFNCNPTTCSTLTFPNLIFTPPGNAPAAPFPGALTPIVTPFTPPSATATTRGQVPDWVNPLVHEGEVTIEHVLPGAMSISGTYMFSRGLRLPMFVDTNLAPSTSTKTYNVLNSSGAVANTITVPYYTQRIDPTGPILTGFSDVNSWYNAMLITLRRNMRHGLEFTANYTLAKASDGGQVPGQFGTFNGTDSAFDPKNRALEYGRSDLDVRSRFVTSLVWAPDYAKKLSNKTARFALDGWNFSTIISASTGFPVTGGINGFASGGPDGGLTGGLVNNSGTGFGGRVPGDRNSFTGPGNKNVDFRIGRTFEFRERYRFTLVGEAFNLFNFTNIYSVNSTEYNLSGLNLVPNSSFFAPLTSNNSLNGARQLQISARFSF